MIPCRLWSSQHCREQAWITGRDVINSDGCLNTPQHVSESLIEGHLFWEGSGRNPELRKSHGPGKTTTTSTARVTTLPVRQTSINQVDVNIFRDQIMRDYADYY